MRWQNCISCLLIIGGTTALAIGVWTSDGPEVRRAYVVPSQATFSYSPKNPHPRTPTSKPEPRESEHQ